MTLTKTILSSWDVTPCNLVEIYLDIWGKFCPLIQNITVNFSGMLNSHQIIRCNIQKESISHSLSSITKGTITIYLFNSVRATTVYSKRVEILSFFCPHSANISYTYEHKHQVSWGLKTFWLSEAIFLGGCGRNRETARSPAAGTVANPCS